ncbi:MAG: hypothetical protein N3E51_02550, partial [Candidatus Micrarchaeota archaeon]|nr:hypothetical protein [Candidatus Micrarchaeota archaeon]
MFLYFYRGLEIPSSLLGEAESLLNKLETIVNDLKRDTSSWFDSGAARELLHPDSPLGKKIRQVEEKIKEARDALAKGDIASAKESLDSLLDALLALSKEKKSMQEKENLKIIASFLEKDVPQAGNELLYLLEKFENEIKKQKAEEGTTTTPPDSKKNYIDVPSVFFTLPAPKKTENNQVEKEETKVVREIREFKTVPIRNQLPKCYNDSSNPNEKSIQDLSKNPENLQKLENYNFDNIEISLQGTKLNIVCGDIDPALILDPNDFADFLRFYYLTCNRLIGDSLPTNLWWEVFDSGELKEPDLLRQLLFSMGAVAAGGDDPYPAQQFNREFSEIKKKFEDYSFLLHKKISYTYSLLNAQRKILYDERKKLEKEREDIYREYSQFEGYEDLVSKRKNNELSADEKKRLDKMEKNSKINKFISKLNENTKKINMISDKIKKIDKDLDALEEMHKTTLKLYEQFIVRVKKVNEKVIEFNDFVEKLVKYNDAYCAMRTNFNSGNIVDYFENRFNPSSKEDMDCLQFLIKRLILAELYLRDNDFPSLDVTLDKSLFYNPNSHTNYNIERKAPISKYENLSMLYYALSSSKNNPLKNLIKNEKDMPSLISTILEDKAGFSSGTPYQALYLGINEKYVELAADALRGDSWWKLHPLLFPPFGSQPFCSLPFSTIFPIPKDKTWVNPDKTKYPDLLDYAVDFVDMFISRLFYPSDPSSYGSYNKQNNDLIPTIPTIRTAREPFLTDWQKRFNFLFNLILAGIPEALSMRAHAYEEAILNPTLNNLARLEEVKGYTNLSIGMSVPLLLLSTVSFANKILSSTPRIARFTIYGKQYAWEVFGLKNPSWELWFVGSEEAGARSILFGTQKSAWGLFFSKHPPGWGGTGLDLVSTFPSHPPPLLTLTSHTSTYLPSTLFPSTYLPSTLFPSTYLP